MLTGLEVTKNGNAVSDCEATVGGCRFDRTLMEERLRRLRCLGIGYQSLWPDESWNTPPLNQKLGAPAGQWVKSNEDDAVSIRCNFQVYSRF